MLPGPEKKIRHMTETWEKKCDALSAMGQNINKLTKQVSDDLMSKDERTHLTALVVRIIMRTSERVGNDVSASNGHFGVTGFTKGHVKKVHKQTGEARFYYTAKSGILQDKTVDLGVLATNILLPLTERRGYSSNPIFVTKAGQRITAALVNAYLKQFDVTAKDIRGYNCNAMMLKISTLQRASGKTVAERKRIFGEALKAVATRIGHSAPTLRKHYLMPRIEEEFLKTGSVNRDFKC
jgi:DNA topoisomerase IB